MRTCTKCNKAQPESGFSKIGRRLRGECRSCRREQAKESYRRNREKRLAAVKQYYQANREEKLEYAKQWYRQNTARCREYGKRGLVRLREQVFLAYGGRCVCCGEANAMFLTIDHIDGNGNKHRRETLGSHLKAGIHTYAWLRQQGYPKGFQVLCFNCNMGRHKNKGICPHQARSAT